MPPGKFDSKIIVKHLDSSKTGKDKIKEIVLNKLFCFDFRLITITVPLVSLGHFVLA